MPTACYLRAIEGGVLLTVRLQPRAGRNEIGAPHGDALRVRVTAPPHRGAANEALLRLLAYTLQCAPSRVQLVRGAAASQKRILLHGFTEEEVLRGLET
jgi:uncharacterized protein (TIGR00251 family)